MLGFVPRGSILLFARCSVFWASPQLRTRSVEWVGRSLQATAQGLTRFVTTSPVRARCSSAAPRLTSGTARPGRQSRSLVRRTVARARWSTTRSASAACCSAATRSKARARTSGRGTACAGPISPQAPPMRAVAATSRWPSTAVAIDSSCTADGRAAASCSPTHSSGIPRPTPGKAGRRVRSATATRTAWPTTRRAARSFCTAGTTSPTRMTRGVGTEAPGHSQAPRDLRATSLE